MKPALTPESSIDAIAAEIANQYTAKGDLELMFCRQIASARVTFDSLQRAVNSLDATNDAHSKQIDYLSRSQARYQRMQAVAVKELKALQERRNIMERFPDQTKDCAPLADHTNFIGEKPAIKQLHWTLRGRMRSPLDNTPLRASDPDPQKAAAGLPDFKHLVPDLKAIERMATQRQQS